MYVYTGNGVKIELGSGGGGSELVQTLGLDSSVGMSQKISTVAHDGVALDGRKTAACKNFAALFPGTGTIESFLFFSDPHPWAGISTEEEAGRLLEPIRAAYRHTPTSFCLCGGDWLQSDVKETALYKLGWIDAYMRKNFSPYVPVLGNHDTNYQGQLLDNTTIRNVFFREEGAGYYKYQAVQSLVYVLDSQVPGGMTEYLWAEIDWLAKALKADDRPHSFVAVHIAIDYAKPVAFCDAYTRVIDAYNKRTTVQLNGQSYDFGGCTGTCHFVLAGHEHYDWNGVINNVPVILITQTKDGDDRAKWPTFDLCMVNYDTHKLQTVRIGNGSNRVIDIL